MLKIRGLLCYTSTIVAPQHIPPPPAPFPTRQGSDSMRLLPPSQDKVFVVFFHLGNCPEKMDIALLVDTSKSMTKGQRSMLAKLIYRFMDKYPVSPKGNHYAFMTFDRYARIHNKFNNQSRYNQKALKGLIEEKIRISKRLKWGTRSDIALYRAAKELFTKEGGDRADAKNILLVFTDGLQRIARGDKVPFKDFSKSTKKLEVSHYFLDYY